MPKHILQEDNCIDYIEFNVSDINAAKKFYGDVFGWTFTDYGELYCEFSDGRMKGGFNGHDPVRLGGPLVVLYHNDLDSLQAKIVAHGGKITKETFEFPGGERFQFSDPEGYELSVWRTI